MSARTNDIQRNQDAVCYVGNLDDRVDDALVWELMLQAGPVVRVHVPRDRVTGQHNAFAFAEFQTPPDADYAMKILNGVKLYGRSIRVDKASSDRRNVDIGANLFVGNLDADADERDLLDAFSAFGTIVSLQVSRDDNNNSKGYGFISFDSFEASDAAKDAMQNQYLRNRPLTVDYAIKKDGKHGEKHGSQAERLVAAQARKHIPASLPTGPPARPVGPPGTAGGVYPPQPAPPSFMPQGMPGAPPPPPPGMPVAYASSPHPPSAQAGFMGYGAYPGAPPPGTPLGMPPPPPPGMMARPSHQGGWHAPPPPPPPVSGYMTGANSAPLGPR